MPNPSNVDPRVWAAVQAAQAEGRILSDRGVNADALGPTLSVRVPLPDEIEVGDENKFQSLTRQLFNQNGWTFYHTHDSRRSDAGMLDCWAGRMVDDVFSQVLVAELKVPPNKPTPAQRVWMKLLAGCGVPVYLWYPHHWKEMKEIACSPPVRTENLVIPSDTLPPPTRSSKTTRRK